ncbi:metallophosphoesterase [Bacillus sp. JJ1566]|uniref:metallophosphoesterase n=1 Tax=Bacillus sp. JJ1566 TaxID=3122961 RepID=UPI003000ADDA
MITISILIVIITAYTVWDNKRIKIEKQEIVIENLPKELENYTILQVTDLHEKEFGNNQSSLINKINSIYYDAIVFTGDMLENKKSTNYIPFYSLLDGIENKKTALFVPGNTDPESYYVSKDRKFLKVDFVTGMEKRGIRLLESLQSVKKGDSNVHFVNFELSIQNETYLKSIEKNIQSKNLSFIGHLEHYNHLYKEVQAIDHKGHNDIVIALTHYPVVDARLDNIASDSMYSLRDIDLILAGHYHGGQIRLPFIGALFVPESWDDNNGFFPPQDRVKGLWKYRNIKQYVSAGLGSSNAKPYLNFRLFNTPEINVLVLKKE